VVASRAASLPEVVGDAGLLFDPDDVAGFVQGVRTVLEDGTEAQRLRTAGLARASLYSWDKAATEVLKIYQRFL
jgi:glycosyltransferase involved in cell wall biosynthesis